MLPKRLAIGLAILQTIFDDGDFPLSQAILVKTPDPFLLPYTGIGQLGENTDATPRDVPLHPGAEKWYREHGFKV